MTAGGGRPESSDRPPGWKVAVALVSLAISLLLWLNGLVTSLDRPSVGHDLNRRQLELAVLAAPQLPPSIRSLLAGAEPLNALELELERQRTSLEEQGTPPPANLLLEQALLDLRQQPRAARSLLRQVAGGGGPEQAIAAALLQEQPLQPSEARRLSEELHQGPLLQQWSCASLVGSGSSCGDQQAASRATIQLVAVTVLPVLTLLVGVSLLGRELWLRWRRGSGAMALLMGPNLSALDVVLLVAGGFVVVGELLTPLLVAPLLEAGLGNLALAPALRQGLSVVGLYLALMAGPLMILWLMLRGQVPAPQGGWLQFRLQPLGTSFRRAFKTFLMVLPLVSLVGWLQGQIWGDPGGSNPLLELVLNSRNLPALACFAFTAVVLAPLFEETIFRGVLLPVAARELGSGWGVVISAAVFAIAHLSLGELPPLFVLGLGLGWLRLSSGRLGASVLMHALWNALTFSNLVLLGS